jgi:hypothetical protein
MSQAELLEEENLPNKLNCGEGRWNFYRAKASLRLVLFHWEDLAMVPMTGQLGPSSPVPQGETGSTIGRFGAQMVFTVRKKRNDGTS